MKVRGVARSHVHSFLALVALVKLAFVPLRAQVYASSVASGEITESAM
ncbi:hypothetical protein [Sulfuracidifex tepidarius]|nr:hypothetical protein [Sulfuracidifex tepidarius]